MASKHKVLIVDDEQVLLDLYAELVRALPSHPEVHTATSGARALALLESDDFSLLLTDLHMPKMDGFQILLMARRNYPALRTAVVTGMADQEYRTRAYSIGADLYIEKPQSRQELKLFIDCIEGLLDKEEGGGFRGVQNKNLVDLVQMESLSHSSSLLRVLQSGREGRIWILDGEVIDAETDDLTGEPAFKRIMGWRRGSFEILPPESGRERRIGISTQSLLLDFAQWTDEKTEATKLGGHEEETNVLKAITQIRGVQSVLMRAGKGKPESWGLEEVERHSEVGGALIEMATELGQKLSAGPLRRAIAGTPTRKLVMRQRNDRFMLLGLTADTTNEEAGHILQRVSGEWS